ncbi:LacI family DNA-binding transcriptional regulator [Sinomonas atrocyanea]|jgi:DNA-binding LacI/PurR family transcriptional regulator|uniref:LacI family DNA-binding transcriptional regulator n=1 Tax=Sinomonas atrocyanea TaxID=37927 RepID=UPI002864A9E6|nr:LacI family DNA-binding transcriptional regulator [Sinomonas atrocyanea]MDR6620303.1 DNA-binding LacI/PurR family transcriptional regulator [Sinomonas atrocyanea]
MVKRRTSLTDVARAAGVGLATASRALTGSAEVGAATRARILETAAELGYRPSSTAQALRTGRTRLIELVVTGRLSQPVVTGLFEACEDRGFHLLLTRQSAPGEGMVARPVVDGRILLDPAPGQEEHPSEEPCAVLRTGGLDEAGLAATARSMADTLIDRVEGVRV